MRGSHRSLQADFLNRRYSEAGFFWWYVLRWNAKHVEQNTSLQASQLSAWSSQMCASQSQHRCVASVPQGYPVASSTLATSMISHCISDDSLRRRHSTLLSRQCESGPIASPNPWGPRETSKGGRRTSTQIQLCCRPQSVKIGRR